MTDDKKLANNLLDSLQQLLLFKRFGQRIVCTHLLCHIQVHLYFYSPAPEIAISFTSGKSRLSSIIVFSPSFPALFNFYRRSGLALPPQAGDLSRRILLMCRHFLYRSDHYKKCDQCEQAGGPETCLST